MKKKFYDVWDRKAVTTEVTGKVKYANGRFAVKGVNNGHSLTLFVKEDEFNKLDVPVVKAPCKKCCKK